MADGWITIGTELSTDKFDKQMGELEKKIKKEEDKKIILDTTLTNQQQELENARRKTDELADAYQRLKQMQDEVASGRATPAQFTTLQELQNTYGTLEQINNSFDKALTKQDLIEQKVTKTKMRYDEINRKVSEYKNKVEKINLQKQQADVQKISNGFKSVGNSLQDAVKKAGKLALGIFAVRSAYSALRRASSELASYDEQYATNLEYIRYALTQAIAPVLKWIVEMTAKLLGYIGMIINALFGINLFSRSSAESFNKMKAGANGVSKAVKEIKKQLTGFDEINMLTEQSDTGTSVGAGGVGVPSFDLSSMQGEPPEWIKWIADNKELILSVLAGIASAIIAIKLGLGGIKALGIGVLVAGLVSTIQNIIAYLKDPSFENFGKLLQSIGVTIIGLGLIMGNWVVVAVGAFAVLAGAVVKHWKEIKTSLQSVIDYIRENWGPLGDFIADIMQGVLDFFDLAINFIKDSFDGFIMFIQGVFSGDWDKAWEGIKKMFQAVWDTILGILAIFGDFVYKYVIKPVFDVFDWLWKAIKQGFENAFNWIKSVFKGIGEFFKGIITTVVEAFSKLGTKVGEAISTAFKNVVNAVLRAIEGILNTPIRAINGLIGVINRIPRC